MRVLMLVVLVMLCGYGPAGETAIVGQIGAPSTVMLSVEGAELEATIWGEGEVVIALPGLGADVAWFKLVGPLIAAKGFRVVGLNPRSVGRSVGSLENLTMSTLARDVIGAMDALHVGRAHLLGWAFGNRVARAAAQNYPDRVATVTLLAAGGLVPASAEVMEAFRRLAEPDLPQATRLRLLSVSLFAASSDIPALLATVQAGTWPEARMAQSAAANAARVESWWSGGRAPMLIVQGREDVMAPPENGLALSKEFPERTTLVWVEQAAHMMLIEQPAAVAAQVTRFLESHRSQ